MQNSFNSFEDFRKKHPTAASSISYWLIAHPEYLSYKFVMAYSFNYADGAKYCADFLSSTNGIVLKLYPSENGYTVRLS